MCAEKFLMFRVCTKNHTLLVVGSLCVCPRVGVPILKISVGIILIGNFLLMYFKFKGEKMEHGRERTEFGGARRAENGVNMFYEKKAVCN